MNTGYSIYVVPDETTDGLPCYRAYHAELPGCMSHGETIDEALQGLDAARDLYLSTLKDLNQPVPQPSGAETVVVWENCSRSLGPQSVSMCTKTLPSTELTANR